LSEAKSRFRVKNGEVEIEYEGPLKEVNEHYKKALEWLVSGKTKGIKKGEAKEKKGEVKRDKRGGRRKPIYPKEIQKLKKEKFFDTKKTLDDVIKVLESKGAPTRGKKVAIRNALIRDTRKKDSKLKTTKEGNTWVFWID